MPRAVGVPPQHRLTFDVDDLKRTVPAQQSTMYAAAFRVLGSLTILFGLLCLLLFFANMGARSSGGHDLSGTILFTIYCLPVGIGMICLYRVFAVLIALPTLAVGLWLSIGSVAHVPFPWMLLNIAFGALLCVPAWLTAKAWKELKPIVEPENAGDSLA